MGAKRMALVVLMACAGGAVAGLVQGRGFAIAAPGGNGWSAAPAGASAVVFQRRAGPTREVDAPYFLSAGATAFVDDALARQVATAPLAARAWLRRRLRAPGRDELSLDVTAATLQGARCAAYDAVQVDHYDPERILPDHVDDRRQYVQHGLLCVHPQAAGRLVQVFYNEQFLRDEAPGGRVGTAEIREFFDGLRWTAQ